MVTSLSTLDLYVRPLGTFSARPDPIVTQTVPVSSRIMLDFLHDAKGTMMAVRANSAGTGRESATGGSGGYGKDSGRGLPWRVTYSNRW